MGGVEERIGRVFADQGKRRQHRNQDQETTPCSDHGSVRVSAAGTWSVGPWSVSATCFIASKRSRRAFGTGVSGFFNLVQSPEGLDPVGRSNRAENGRVHTPFTNTSKIDVVYGPAEGRTATAQQVARSIRLLETVAEHAADQFVWPAPFTLEMQSCGSPNAHWDLATHKLTVCYELAPEFADLYRAYGDARADGTRTADNSNRKTVGAVAFKPNRHQPHHKSRLRRERPAQGT